MKSYIGLFPLKDSMFKAKVTTKDSGFVLKVNQGQPRTTKDQCQGQPDNTPVTYSCSGRYYSSKSLEVCSNASHIYTELCPASPDERTHEEPPLDLHNSIYTRII